MNYLKRSLAAFVIIVATALFTFSATLQPSHTPIVASEAFSVKELTLKMIDEIDTTLEVKLARIADDKLGKSAANESIMLLRTAAEVVAKESRDLTTMQPLRYLGFFGSYMSNSERDKYFDIITKNKALRIQNIEDAVAAVEAASIVENATIQAAEEEAARQAEAAAAAAEAAARQPGGGSSESSGDYSGSYSEGEDYTGRIGRIMASLPFYVPYVASDDCSIGLACYVFNSGIIRIGSGVSGYSDCNLRMVIAHEYRHYWQEINGVFQFDGAGNLLNRDALESDAYSFGYGYGC